MIDHKSWILISTLSTKYPFFSLHCVVPRKQKPPNKAGDGESQVQLKYLSKPVTAKGEESYRELWQHHTLAKPEATTNPPMLWYYDPLARQPQVEGWGECWWLRQFYVSSLGTD